MGVWRSAEAMRGQGGKRYRCQHVPLRSCWTPKLAPSQASQRASPAGPTGSHTPWTGGSSSISTGRRSSTFGSRDPFSRVSGTNSDAIPESGSDGTPQSGLPSRRGLRTTPRPSSNGFGGPGRRTARRRPPGLRRLHPPCHRQDPQGVQGNHPIRAPAPPVNNLDVGALPTGRVPVVVPGTPTAVGETPPL